MKVALLCPSILMSLCAVSACGSSSGTTNAPDFSVVGDWDVTATHGKNETTGKLSITTAGFSLNAGGALVEFEVSGDTATLAYKPSADLSADVIANETQGGVVPFMVGGAWTFKNEDGERCSLLVDTKKVSSTCDLDVKGFHLKSGWSAKKTDEGTSSIFGDFTGTWRFTGEKGDADISFDGSTLSISDVDGKSGMTLTFAADRASGTLGDKDEISAKRQ